MAVTGLLGDSCLRRDETRSAAIVSTVLEKIITNCVFPNDLSQDRQIAQDGYKRRVSELKELKNRLREAPDRLGVDYIYIQPRQLSGR